MADRCGHCLQVLGLFKQLADFLLQLLNQLASPLGSQKSTRRLLDVLLQRRDLSDCLYDAEKFRWGPDNFTDTVWDMVAVHNPPLSDFIKYYPRGMRGIEKIKTTFRTATGKIYGPQFIELGITIGNMLYRTILDEFDSDL